MFISNDYPSLISTFFKAWLKVTRKKLALSFCLGHMVPQVGKDPVVILMSTPFVNTITQELGSCTQRASPMKDSAEVYRSESWRNPLTCQSSFVIVTFWVDNIF